MLFLSVGTEACRGATRRPCFWVRWPLESLRREHLREGLQASMGATESGRGWGRPPGRLDRLALTPSLSFCPSCCPQFKPLPCGSEMVTRAGFDEASVASNQRIWQGYQDVPSMIILHKTDIRRPCKDMNSTRVTLLGPPQCLPHDPHSNLGCW